MKIKVIHSDNSFFLPTVEELGVPLYIVENSTNKSFLSTVFNTGLNYRISRLNKGIRINDNREISKYINVFNHYKIKNVNYVNTSINDDIVDKICTYFNSIIYNMSIIYDFFFLKKLKEKYDLLCYMKYNDIEEIIDYADKLQNLIGAYSKRAVVECIFLYQYYGLVPYLDSFYRIKVDKNFIGIKLLNNNSR
jgi:hypothetical protein